MTSIYCKTISNDKQAFYLGVDGEEYLLFVQKYKKSNRLYFGNGLPLSAALCTKGVKSAITLRTIDRLRPAIRYIENEYDLCVLDSTKKKQAHKAHDKRKAPYKRQKFILGNDVFAA